MAVTATVDLKGVMLHRQALHEALLGTCFMPCDGLPDWVGDACVRSFGPFRVHGITGPRTWLWYHPTHGYEARLVYAREGVTRWVGCPVKVNP